MAETKDNREEHDWVGPNAGETVHRKEMSRLQGPPAAKRRVASACRDQLRNLQVQVTDLIHRKSMSVNEEESHFFKSFYLIVI